MNTDRSILTSGNSSNVMQIGNDSIHYLQDDYTDGWTTPDTVIMLHGIAEKAEIWNAWVPTMARAHRIIRPDLRGYGRSSALPEGKIFTISDWADDIERLIIETGSNRVHLVATKLGALIAFELAQRHLPAVASMTLAGMLPSPSASLGPWIEEWLDIVEREGVEGWARATMLGRMGTSLPPAAMEWWTKLMGTAPTQTVSACFRLLPGIHGPANPEGVECPTLFIVAKAKAAKSDFSQQPSSDDLMRLKSRVMNAQWVEVEADSYHIAASHPDACAEQAEAFIASVNHAAPSI